MAKKKKSKTPQKGGKKGRPQSKAKAKAKPTKRASWQKKDGTPKWLKADGTVNKRYKKIAKYLTKDGKIKKGAKLPFKVKRVSTLFDKLYNPKYPEWYTKKGQVRKVMLKYLTKQGKLRKGVQLPKGVKTIKQLWDWVKANKVKSEDDKMIKCVDITEPYWIVKEFVTRAFKRFLKVFMEGSEIKEKTWKTNGDDYINSITDWDASPPEATYTICYFKKYKYLFV